jgi:hypothetical protein
VISQALIALPIVFTFFFGLLITTLLLFLGENGRMTGVIWPVESEFDGTLF